MHLVTTLFVVASSICVVNAAVAWQHNHSDVQTTYKGVTCTFDLDMCGWQQNVSNKYDWIRQAYGDDTQNTGPSADHTTGQGSYLFVKPKYPAHSQYRSEMSYKFAKPVIKGCLSLYYHMYNIRHGSLIVRLGSEREFRQKYSQNDEWKLWTIPITSQTDVISISAGAEGGEIAIDDITYSNVCPKAVKCWHPEVPAFSNITPDEREYNVGENVTYRCVSGVQPSGGNSSITCMNDGAWSGVVPTCFGVGVVTVCGTPPQAPDTELVTNITAKPGDSMKHRCRDGYAPEFQTACQCLDTGRWDQRCATSIRCREIPGAPVNFTLSSNRHDCIELQWREPKNRDLLISRYQTRCGNWTSYSKQEWRTFTSTGYSSCGGSSHRPYQQWKCDVRSLNGLIASSIVTSAAIRTPCDAPTAPVNLTFGTPKQVTSQGKRIWSYKVTWQAPKYINCKSLDPHYAYDVQSSVSPSEKTTISQPEVSSLLVDGNTRITVTVSARNDGGFISPPATATITTPLLSLPHPPVDLALTGLNSSCLELSWRRSDDSDTFQYRCGRMTWQTLTALSVVHCGLRPNSDVKCDVRSMKGPSHSNSTSLAAKTHCAAPSMPRNIQVSPAFAISKDKFSYTVTWQPPLEINCDSLGPYLVVYPTIASAGTKVANTNFTIVAGWNDNISVNVFAQSQNGSLKSAPATAAFNTPRRAKSMDGSTRNVTSISCPKGDYYVVANRQTGEGNVKLDIPGGGSYHLSLPAGIYPFEIVTGNGLKCGKISLRIIAPGDTPTYRMQFNIQYQVACADIDKSSLSFQTLFDSAAQNIVLLKKLCGEDCVLTGNYTTECSRDTLTVRYSTTSVFNQTATKESQDIRAAIQKLLIQNGSFLPVVVINRVPPVVYPSRNQDGSSASLVLSPFCAKGEKYDEKLHICRGM